MTRNCRDLPEGYLEEIICCLDSETNGVVNSKLMHFDCKRIINDSFTSVFNEPEKATEYDCRNDVADN